MTQTHPLYKAAIAAHTQTTMATAAISKALSSRIDFKDDRGDVTPRTVGIAVMTAAAVAVGATITQKILAKEATIVLD